jgi:hypothetical protein
MAQIKTRANARTVTDFLATVENPVRHADAERIIAIMERISGQPATMWGPSIIGFGSYHYRYESGHEGDMCRIGFSPRAGHLVLYIGANEQEERLARLGKHKRGKGCLYVNKLADIELNVLEEMIAASWSAMSDRYPD